MTTQEKNAIHKLIENTRGVTVQHSEWDFSKGGLGRVELNSVEEASRLFASDDYRKGWEACYREFSETLKFIASAKASDLRKYAGK